MQKDRPSSPPAGAESTQAFLRRAKRRDAIARGVIHVGGIGIIAVVVGIFVLIVGVALPLFKGARVDRVEAQPRFADPASILAIGLDDYGHGVFALRKDGRVEGLRADGQPLWSQRLGGETNERTIAAHEPSGHNRFTVTWSDGAVSLVEVSAKPEFTADGARSIRNEAREIATFAPVEPRALRTRVVMTDRGPVRADWLPGGLFRVVRQEEKTDFLGNRKQSTARGEFKHGCLGEVTDFLVDGAGNRLLVGTDRGELAEWNVRRPEAAERVDVQSLPAGLGVRRLAFVFGETSVAVADQAGGLTTWMPARRSPEAPERVWTPIHVLRGHAAGIREVVPSGRTKSLFTLGQDGAVQAEHMTSGRALWRLAPPASPVVAFAMNGRDDRAAVLGADGVVSLWDIDNPHPEISLSTLFGRVWYEGADEPAHVWQSSAGTDDYEPKLSLVPLISGTLKGTFYSLLLAAPLAVFGALYVSQFMGPRLRRVVKPSVEIMAAIPSVVLGFLAGLWLAPLLENRLPGVFLMLVLVPLTCFAGIRALRALRVKGGGQGAEFAAMIPMVLIGVWLSMLAGAALEARLPGGDFRGWIFETFGVRVDQRNAIIIAFALGFTVTPVIFTLAEDAFSAVPRNLTAASLALGASRWQTAWRVVLPSASPGLFAAVMIGIGRAVGETMIVLMATGNTPILDWGPFNGMRTLSANIAVEIPEAPHDGTLYRTLFLSGCVLFAFTFTLNTVAEVIRIRLRRKYGNY